MMQRYNIMQGCYFSPRERSMIRTFKHATFGLQTGLRYVVARRQYNESLKLVSHY
jgi:hypothetical protein